jgi:hypothetical protein
MALLQNEELVNYCEFRTRRRKDNTTYRVKTEECGNKTCKYSDSYEPPTTPAAPTTS